MRPHAFIPVALVLCACSNAHDQSTASSSPTSTPPPLRSCETRDVTIDGVDMVVQANVDGTPATVTVVNARSDNEAKEALVSERKIFGQEHRDTRVQTQQIKDGLVKITDMCGNLATYPPPSTPSAAPSPVQK